MFKFFLILLLLFSFSMSDAYAARGGSVGGRSVGSGFSRSTPSKSSDSYKTPKPSKPSLPPKPSKPSKPLIVKHNSSPNWFNYYFMFGWLWWGDNNQEEDCDLEDMLEDDEDCE